MSTGLILAAPASGSGKTTLTLAILRALKNQGYRVAAAKSGPDYIDPRFHEAACGGASVTLDAWAMDPNSIRALAGQSDDKLLIIEGAMGLFDGAPPDGRGSTADLARILGLPVILIVDASQQAQSVAALVEGFAQHRADVQVAGLILNKIGSPRHETIIRRALGGFPVFGAVPRDAKLGLPSRHLGLVQAAELVELERFLDDAASIIADRIDLRALVGVASKTPGAQPFKVLLPPIGQRIAIAKDHAFSFIYPHIREGWIKSGASIHPFSPLNNEAPDPRCDAIFLPGGYPELHAGKIANASNFATSMRAAATADITIYGECGGYMVLGDGLIDAEGARHAMLGLLRLETSFEKRQLHLGYRRLKSLGGAWAGDFNGHEFHYSSVIRSEGTPLFAAENAEGEKLESMGLFRGSVCGSYAHLIAKALPA